MEKTNLLKTYKNSCRPTQESCKNIITASTAENDSLKVTKMITENKTRLHQRKNKTPQTPETHNFTDFSHQSFKTVNNISQPEMPKTALNHKQFHLIR